MCRLSSKTPPTFSPSLVFPHKKNYRKQTFFTLSDSRWYTRCVPEMRTATCIACHDGWLLMVSFRAKLSRFYLFNPVSVEKLCLPPLPVGFQIRCGIITSSPTKNPENCVVILINNQSCICCNLTSSRWIHKFLEPENEEEKKILEHGMSAACYKGKVYILSSGRFHDVIIELVIEQVATPSPTITLHELNRPNSTMPNTSRNFPYLVESCGEIFLVEKRGLRDSTIIHSFEVYKLDLSAVCWIKVETLADRILLLGISSISVSATQLGVQGECIYFFENLEVFCEDKEPYLYKFNMDTGSITVTQPCPKLGGQWSRPYWLLPDKLSPHPNRSMLDRSSSFMLPNINSMVKPLETNGKDREKEVEEEIGILKGLPNEIICYISTYLLHNHADLQNLVDYIYFRSTCKNLTSILPALCSVDTSSNHLTPFGFRFQQPPWLMSISTRNFKYKFHHPVNNLSFTHDFPELAGSAIHHSKYGWFLMSKETNSFFFFNPITRETIKLPDPPEFPSRNIVGLSFSSAPTSSNYIVLGHRDCPHLNEVFIVVYKCGQDSWQTYEHMYKESFKPSYCNCVFYDGFFYCLDRDGKLGVFDTKKDLDDDSVWSIIANDNVVKDIHRSFLMECDGEILSVFIADMCRPICVFRLEKFEKEMKWVSLQNLGDKIIFLSHTTSILVRADSKAMKNKIFLPILREKRSVFYSLSTGKYHTIGSNDSRDDCINNTCTELYPTWFESDGMDLIATKDNSAN